MKLYEFQASWSYTEKPYLRVCVGGGGQALLAAPYHCKNLVLHSTQRIHKLKSIYTI